jgi:hypothetical protein
MKTTGTLLVALVALVVAPQALASAQSKAARDAATAACKSERAAVGAAIFTETYGSNGLGACKSEYAAAAGDAAKNAAAACRAERKKNPRSFRKKYGLGKKKRDAFGRCVSKRARGGMGDAVTENVSAAQDCRDFRDEDPEGFADMYGSEADSFALCVVDTKALNDEDGTDDPGDEGDDPGDEDDGTGDDGTGDDGDV